MCKNPNITLIFILKEFKKHKLLLARFHIGSIPLFN